ncbi:MAG: hypothetical protein JNK25_00345 [Phycisphaerae bacterium]|nr:hypothetical protein [Phycisphaerae bacterium]
MQRSLRSWYVPVVLGVSSALGQSAGEIADRLRSMQVTDPVNDARLRGHEFHYEYETFIDMSDARLAYLERETAGKPDHPLRHDLEVTRRARTHGGLWQSTTIYLYGPNSWRFCLDDRDGRGTFLDAVEHHRLSWQLNPRLLAITDPTNPRGSFRPASMKETWARELRFVFGAGLGPCVLSEKHPNRVTRGTFEIHLDIGGGMIVRALGELQHDETVVVRETRVIECPMAPDFVGERRAFAGGTTFQSCGLFGYTRVERSRTPGQPDARLVNFAVAPISHPAEDVLALPTPGREDPIRGPVSQVRVIDERGDSIKTRSFDDARTSRVLPQHPGESPRRDGGFPGWVVWMVLPGIGLVMWIVVRKVRA